MADAPIGEPIRMIDISGSRKTWIVSFGILAMLLAVVFADMRLTAGNEPLQVNLPYLRLRVILDLGLGA